MLHSPTLLAALLIGLFISLTLGRPQTKNAATEVEGRFRAELRSAIVAPERALAVAPEKKPTAA